MTHASGIRSSTKLTEDIKFAKENKIRCIQIKIENESLIMENHDKAEGSFETDYDRCIEKYLQPDQCCYILYRTDTTTNLGHEWLFLHWVPDKASIREKMLYASTRSTIKREFGEGYIVEDITGHDKPDLLYSGYLKYQESKSAPPPLTLAEQELIEIKKNERETALGDGHRTLKCSGFPPTDDLIEELTKFSKGEIDFLEMSIEIDKETIKNDSSKPELSCDLLRSSLNPDKARYYLYRFRHTFENESYEPIIFVYNMPGFSSSVKERMLYSSCKAPFLEMLQSEFQLNIQRKDEPKYTMVLPYSEVLKDYKIKICKQLGKLNYRIVSKSCKIRSMFVSKSQTPVGLCSDLVYLVTCNGCNGTYIGETSRHLCTRVQEHCRPKVVSNIKDHNNLEVISGDFSDLVTDNLLLDIHPPQIDTRPKITKPPGPSKRGPRRLMKD